MAVITSYSFGFVESIDPFSITGRADAASLSGGGVAVVGDHAGHTDLTNFQANGDLAGSASSIPGVDAAVTQLSNGNIVVLADTGTDMSFRIVTTAGATVLADTSIGENGTDVLDPEVAALTGGGFVVAIQDFFGGTDNDVDLRIYDNSGALITNFAVDATTANDQNPSVAGLNDGGFAVAWHRNIGSESELWYAVYNANGTVRTAPALRDTAGTVNRNASVVALDNGGFAIAYEDNGWAPANTDIDITLVRFDSAGTAVGVDNITTSTANDTAPSATVLSNGMIAVGYTNDTFSDTDTRVTLVDQNTGAALGTSTIGGSLNNESQITIAAMNNGQIGAFNTDSTAGDVVGSIRQATRFSTGDAAADTITGDDLRDVVSAGDGDDTIRGGLNSDNLNGGNGNDTFTFGAGETASGETVDGGADFDRLLALGDVSFLDVSLTSIEEIEFNFPNASPTTVSVRADQIGAGLASDLLVDGNLNGVADTLHITMGADIQVDLDDFTFTTFDTGGAENDRIIVQGDGDAEIIAGSSLRDDIFGEGGNDSLNGRGGADVLSGGLGDDRFFVDNVDDDVLEAIGGGTDRVIAGLSYVLDAGQEIETLDVVISGATTAINLRGNEFSQTLLGNAGANILNGDDGADIMRGFAGNDTYFVDNAADQVFESAAAGQGNDRVIAGVDYQLAAGQEIETLDVVISGATTAINLRGNEFDQTLLGNAGANILNGDDGEDIMRGFAGNDSYFVDNVLDQVFESAAAGQGNDRVITSISYELAGGQEIERLEVISSGATTPINLTGNDFRQTLLGNAGANILNGEGGNDEMRGFNGADTYFVDNALDQVFESAAPGGGNDRVIASTSYTLAAGQEVERLEVISSGAVTPINLTGNELRQTLLGNAGDNVLNGKAGNDAMRGFGGNDIFVFDTPLGAANIDAILDYSVADDTIRLENAIFIGTGGGVLAASAFQIGAAAADASDRVIYNDATGALFYDGDGSGGGAQIQFANLSNGLAMTNADFFVV